MRKVRAKWLTVQHGNLSDKGIAVRQELTRDPSQKDADIARLVGCSRENVRQHRVFLGLPSSRIPYTSEDAERELTAIREGALMRTLRGQGRSLHRTVGQEAITTAQRAARFIRSPVYNDNGEKRCVSCKLWKQTDAFYVTAPSWDGLNQRCSACSKKGATQNYSTRRGKYQEPTVTKKRCPCCGETKPAAGFDRMTASTSGLQTYCRKCLKIRPFRARLI